MNKCKCENERWNCSESCNARRNWCFAFVFVWATITLLSVAHWVNYIIKTSLP